MFKAGIADKGHIIEILSRSFVNNHSVKFIVHQDELKQRRIRALMDYSFQICSLFDDIWLSEDRQACALILYPHQRRITFTSVWLDILLIIRVVGIGEIRKMLRREAQIKNMQPKEQMCYIWFVGVEPKSQGKGLGTHLIQKIIAIAAKAKLPVYLETSMISNLLWYENLGFQIYGQVDLGYTLFFLKRETVNK